MLIYLLRHGIAEPSSPDRDDAARQLTPEGVERIERQAEALRQAGFSVDHLLTSPLVRARQTAVLVAPAFGLTPEDDALLRPGCTLADVAELARRYSDAEGLLLVGHQPDLGRLVQALTGSRAKMRTGTLAVIDVQQVRSGGGVLVGLYDPEVLMWLAPARG